MLINQRIEKISCRDFNTFCSEHIIWEESLNLGTSALIIGFLFFFVGILIFPIGLFFCLPMGFLSIYYPKRNLIKFTDLNLIVRKRLLKKTKKFEFNELYKVDIVIIKRKIYYHSDSGTYNAILKFKLKIITIAKEYNYKFTWIHSKKIRSGFKGYREAKAEAIKKRALFEQHLKELEKLFPSLITFMDDYPIEKQLKYERKKKRITFSIFLLLILSSLLISDVNKDWIFLKISFIELIIFFILTLTAKSNKNEDLLSKQPKQEKYSKKKIIIIIVNAVLILFFAIILSNMIAYILLFLLKSLV